MNRLATEKEIKDLTEKINTWFFNVDLDTKQYIYHLIKSVRQKPYLDKLFDLK